jgi:hypothetical protein
MKNLRQKVIIGIFVLYFIVAFVVYTPHYNWQYAKTHGFAKWIVLGEIIAIVKAVAWPYFVFDKTLTPLSQQLLPEIELLDSHINKAIDYVNKAATTIDKIEDPYQTTRADREEVIGYYKKALAEAKKADIESMNHHYTGFGDHFRDEFIKGLELFIQGYEKHDEMTFDASQALLRKWKNWYQANMEGFRGR